MLFDGRRRRMASVPEAVPQEPIRHAAACGAPPGLGPLEERDRMPPFKALTVSTPYRPRLSAALFEQAKHRQRNRGDGGAGEKGRRGAFAIPEPPGAETCKQRSDPRHEPEGAEARCAQLAR